MLWASVRPRRKLQIFGLVVIYVLSAISEAISLATLLPFIAILLDPTRLDAYVPSLIIEAMPVGESRVFLIATAYIILVIFAALIRLLALFLNNRIAFMLGADIAEKIYRLTLNQSYEFFLGKNSSQLVDLITRKSDALISGAIIPALQSIGALIYIVIIVAILTAISPLTTIFLIFSLTLSYALISFFTKKKSLLYGNLISSESSKLVKTIQEAMQSKKDLTINQSQNYFVEKYHAVDIRLRSAESANQFLLHSPKILLELLAIVLMIILAMFFLRLDIDSSIFIPIMAAFALGSQRLLPSFQQIYAAVSNIHARKSMLDEVVNSLSLGMGVKQFKNTNPIVFNYALRLKDVCFQYPQSDVNSLRNINLCINKGDRIGIQGSSGAGKSTLINLLLGLIEPTNGFIYCDDKKYLSLSVASWYELVSHVPQEVPLLDATLLENIGYGLRLDQINLDDVRLACELAQILTEIEDMPKGLMTIVGESGERLSGGQKQRIGIARALYKKSQVLILDEFTSALDFDTEREVIKIIESLSREITIITVAHRERALSICDKQFVMYRGTLLTSAKDKAGQ